MVLQSSQASVALACLAMLLSANSHGGDGDSDHDVVAVVVVVVWILASSDMRSSKFCLVACGNGWASTRMVHAVTSGCVPVVITPNITNAFERGSLLPYDDFALRLQREQVPDLPHILRSVISMLVRSHGQCYPLLAQRRLGLLRLYYAHE